MPTLRRQPPENSAQTELALPQRTVVQAEANMLHFPFFALHTKGLRYRKGIEVVGTKRISNESHQFNYRVTRNSDFTYPGPLSRKTHFALLSILSDPARSTIPHENPVTWAWRDLADRMRLRWSGKRTIESIKGAIASTHGVVITSNYALVHRADGGKIPLPSRRRGYHLYQEYCFHNEIMPDGRIAENNSVWLSDWYLANLNSLYSGPVNYDLWLRLNEQSPIASRVYEYLLFKFYARIPKLTINYPHFASFLPIRAEPYVSQAHLQLNCVFELLRIEDVLSNVEWTTSRGSAIQLQISPGPALTTRPALAETTSTDASFEGLTVRELLLSETSEDSLVKTFHQLWNGNINHRPLAGEHRCAKELLQRTDKDTLETILPRVVRDMKTSFPRATTFGAARTFLENELNRQTERRFREAEAAQHVQQQREDEFRTLSSKRERAARKQRLLEKWSELPESSQKRIRQQAIDRATSESIRRIIQQRSTERPAVEVLDALASETGLPRILSAD